MSTPHDDRRRDPLTPGLYDELVSAALDRRIAPLRALGLVEEADIDADVAHARVAQYLEHILASALATYRGGEGSERRRALVERILQGLVDELGSDWSNRLELLEPLKRLLAIREDSRALERPDTPLARSALLTGTRIDPSLASQLSKEIAAADRVDILCSFIKWSGLRLIRDALTEFTDRHHDGPPRLRVISTSYMGATDPRAIDALSALPGTEVKLSYDTARTRLHAKAYVIHRDTGFGSAYIGSANLSRAALPGSR